jgi:hypothetical protein
MVSKMQRIMRPQIRHMVLALSLSSSAGRGGFFGHVADYKYGVVQAEQLI